MTRHLRTIIGTQSNKAANCIHDTPKTSCHDINMNLAAVSYRISDSLRPNKIPVLILIAWFLYLVLSPFYVFPKGRPQPADFILALAILPVLITQLLKFRTKIPLLYVFGGLFVLLTVAVNFINYLFYPDIRFLLTAMIYPYNLMVFAFVVWLFNQDITTAKKWTFWGLVVTIFIQLAVLQFDTGFRGYRGTGGFENPNQFAYWVLLTAAIIVFLRRSEPLHGKDWILIGLLSYMQALALSKAGIIAFGVFLFFLFITPKMPKRGYLVVFFVILSGFLYSLYNYDLIHNFFENIEPLKNVTARLESIGTEADDSPEARGYFRIIEYPLYSLFGSGEGAFYRFNAEGYNRELHSGLATIIFSYGVFGAILFSTFLFLIIHRQPWYYVLLFVPIIMFGLPHQNFRFAHFWVFLGINYGLFWAYYKEKILKQNETPQ